MSRVFVIVCMCLSVCVSEVYTPAGFMLMEESLCVYACLTVHASVCVCVCVCRGWRYGESV